MLWVLTERASLLADRRSILHRYRRGQPGGHSRSVKVDHGRSGVVPVRSPGVSDCGEGHLSNAVPGPAMRRDNHRPSEWNLTGASNRNRARRSTRPWQQAPRLRRPSRRERISQIGGSKRSAPGPGPIRETPSSRPPEYQRGVATAEPEVVGQRPRRPLLSAGAAHDRRTLELRVEGVDVDGRRQVTALEHRQTSE